MFIPKVRPPHEQQRSSEWIGRFIRRLAGYNIIVKDTRGVSGEGVSGEGVYGEFDANPVSNAWMYFLLRKAIHTNINVVDGDFTIPFGDYMTVSCNLDMIVVSTNFTGEAAFHYEDSVESIDILAEYITLMINAATVKQ